MSKNEILVILGNQLFPIEHIKKTNVNKIFMAEDFGLTTEHKHHKLKILMFLWSMRQYRDDLVKNGYEVFYHSIEDDNFKDKFEDKVLEVIKKKKITTIKFFEIEDHFFETKFNNFISKNNLKCEIINNPMFLTSRLEFRDFLKSQKKLIRMASFYQKIRQKMSILIDDQNKPLGGKWSYDEYNRKKIPKNIDIPKIPPIQNDKKFKSLK